jgi:DtxR family Mn-dependent transcriptional regulator
MNTSFDSVVVLLIALGLLTIILWIFWPQKGFWAHLTVFKMNNRRIFLEDALKYLYDCEYKKLQCSEADISRNLKISAHTCTELLERLQRMNLVTKVDGRYCLTDTGKSYSLRIIRVHRIWESYLADETGLKQTEWHTTADHLEHLTSDDAADQLAADIGNPAFDPHGDPIPSSAGDLPEFQGVPLNKLKKGEHAHIVHLEDEPDYVYSQLVALGLYPGMGIYVLDVEKNRISFAADGEECVLTPLFASSITVKTDSGKQVSMQVPEKLSDLKIGESAEIAGISPNCRGQERRRLMDLGVVPGSKISALLKSASGDPVGYRIMDTTIGIRKSQSDMIFIRAKSGSIV